MTAAITAILALLEQLLPLVLSTSNTTLVAGIIEMLTQLMPLIVQEVQTLAPAVKNIITALQADPTTTADQLVQLQALDKQCDDAFEAAAADTDAEVSGGAPTT